MVLIQGLIVSSMAHCDAQQSQQAATEIVRASSHFRGFSIFKLQATDLKILYKQKQFKASLDFLEFLSVMSLRRTSKD